MICSQLPKSSLSDPGSSLKTLAVCSLLRPGPINNLLMNRAGLVEEHNVVFCATRSAVHMPWGISISLVPPGWLPAPPGSRSCKCCVNICSACTQQCILFLGRTETQELGLVTWTLGSQSGCKLEAHRWDRSPGRSRLKQCWAVGAAASILLPSPSLQLGTGTLSLGTGFV